MGPPPGRIRLRGGEPPPLEPGGGPGRLPGPPSRPTPRTFLLFSFCLLTPGQTLCQGVWETVLVCSSPHNPARHVTHFEVTWLQPFDTLSTPVAYMSVVLPWGDGLDPFT